MHFCGGKGAAPITSRGGGSSPPAALQGGMQRRGRGSRAARCRTGHLPRQARGVARRIGPRQVDVARHPRRVRCATHAGVRLAEHLLTGASNNVLIAYRREDVGFDCGGHAWVWHNKEAARRDMKLLLARDWAVMFWHGRRRNVAVTRPSPSDSQVLSAPPAIRRDPAGTGAGPTPHHRSAAKAND